MKESLKDSEEERRKKRRKGRRREETWERRRRKKRNNSLIGALQIEDFLQENPERGWRCCVSSLIHQGSRRMRLGRQYWAAYQEGKGPPPPQEPGVQAEATSASYARDTKEGPGLQATALSISSGQRLASTPRVKEQKEEWVGAHRWFLSCKNSYCTCRVTGETWCSGFLPLLKKELAAAPSQPGLPLLLPEECPISHLAFLPQR